MSAGTTFHKPEDFGPPMAKVALPIRVKVEILDIYHYIKSQQVDIRHRVTLTNFGPSIGIRLPTTTLFNILRQEEDLRKAVEVLPEGAHYVVNRKNEMVEEVLLRWIESQRNQRVPVNGKMIKQAASVTYIVLADYSDPPHDATSGTVPFFSASWFNAFKKRYQITI
ncbi:hypothetical protein BGZ58_009628 [Dissophora ornata]|nr:hypothetical protein BGZ58_009628 [Dissophora ornata]